MFHHTHVTSELAKGPRPPAGFLMASLTEEGVELTGWALQHNALEIRDHENKVLVTALTSEKGQWALTFPYEKKGKPLQTFNVTYIDASKTNTHLGTLVLFMPVHGVENAYLWSEGDQGPQLLQAPINRSDDFEVNLFWMREGQQPFLAGHSAPDSLIQVYDDRNLLGTTTANSEGYWVLRALIHPEHKVLDLRFDEIQTLPIVAERLAYHIDWQDSEVTQSEEPVLLKTTKESWLLGANDPVGRRLMSVFKREAGEMQDATDEKPGQVIPIEETTGSGQ
jgi:hypothetical protein